MVDHAERLTKTDLDARLDQFQSQLEGDLKALSRAIDRGLRRQTWISGGTMAVGVALAFAAGRLA